MRSKNNALRSLSSVEPADYAALAALDSDTLAALLRRVRIASRSVDYRSDEVESLASLIVGRVFSGDIDKAASVAVALASRTVSQAYAGQRSLDAWAEGFGDMVETYIATGAERASMVRAWCPRPDSAYATTPGDVIRAALLSLGWGEHHGTTAEDRERALRLQERGLTSCAWHDGTYCAECHGMAVAYRDHGRILRDACTAYLAHGDRRCSECNDPTSAGRRVSLVGILAHTRGLSGSDSQYHAIRRAVLAALRSLDVAALRSEHFYPYAEGGRVGSVSLDREDRLTAPDETGLPDCDLVTVRRPGEAPVTHSQEHFDALRSERSEDDKRADRIAEALAAAPSRAVRRTERKRSGGTGAYGSQVGARPGQSGVPWHPMPKSR